MRVVYIVVVLDASPSTTDAYFDAIKSCWTVAYSDIPTLTIDAGLCGGIRYCLHTTYSAVGVPEQYFN